MANKWKVSSDLPHRSSSSLAGKTLEESSIRAFCGRNEVPITAPDGTTHYVDRSYLTPADEETDPYQGRYNPMTDY